MIPIKKYTLFIFWALLLGSVVSCKKYNPYAKYQPFNQYDGTIYDYLVSQPATFDSVLYVLQKAGLTGMLKADNDTLTFFAPTNKSLQAAMNEYNVYLLSRGLSSVGLDGIDSSSWRSILTPYLFQGAFGLTSFEGQDGLTITSIALRTMIGLSIKHNAGGAKQLGAETIQLSYPNGSKFSKDWISTNVTTSDIKTKNGIIDILENRHILGFNYFINKAKELQNVYSETKSYATGSLTFPNQTIRLWQDRVKKLTAIAANTIETEAADLRASNYGMRLMIGANDSIQLQPAPWSANQTIEKSGPCYFDPSTLSFILNYRYWGSDGYRVINEKINYTAEAAYIH